MNNRECAHCCNRFTSVKSTFEVYKDRVNKLHNIEFRCDAKLGLKAQTECKEIFKYPRYIEHLYKHHKQNQYKCN